jgi:cytochrome c oxidase subunit II
VRRKVFVLLLALSAALAFSAAAYAGNGGFAPATPSSPNASRINDTYKLIAVFTGVIFVIVEGALVWFIFRYRNRGRPRSAEGPQIHAHSRLELMWTAVPIVIVAVIAAFVFYKLPGIKDVPPAKAQGGPLVVRIDAHQFYWQFTYPDGATSIDELHAPVNRVVRVEIHSQDVDHSWWVPELGGKFDAIPGRTTHTWFQARRMGTYRGQCGEFCGVFHAEMAARVLVETESAYRSFLSSAREPMLVGGQEWRGVCAKCHGISGKGGYGPAIQNNSVLVQHEGLLRLLNDGQNVLKPLASYMPPVGRGWSDAQVKALEMYLKARIYKGTTGGG